MWAGVCALCAVTVLRCYVKRCRVVPFLVTFFRVASGCQDCCLALCLRGLERHVGGHELVPCDGLSDSALWHRGEPSRRAKKKLLNYFTVIAHCGGFSEECKFHLLSLLVRVDVEALEQVPDFSYECHRSEGENCITRPDPNMELAGYRWPALLSLLPGAFFLRVVGALRACSYCFVARSSVSFSAVSRAFLCRSRMTDAIDLQLSLGSVWENLKPDWWWINIPIFSMS